MKRSLILDTVYILYTQFYAYINNLDIVIHLESRSYRDEDMIEGFRGRLPFPV